MRLMVSKSRNFDSFEKRTLILAIESAERHGYFNEASRDFLLEELFPEELTDLRTVLSDAETVQTERLEKFASVDSLCLAQRRLRTISQLHILRNLRICCLAQNFITSFDSLLRCHQLVKLDLRQNQISELPAAELWNNMKKLRILLLHNNPISKFEGIYALSRCDELVWLTLMDCPISLHADYRHFCVNVITSLKALDCYIVSDFEVMEDYSPRPRFEAFSRNLKLNVDFCPAAPYDASVLFAQQISRINQVLKHHSPVLLIQRYFRGHLTRLVLHIRNRFVLWPRFTSDHSTFVEKTTAGQLPEKSVRPAVPSRIKSFPLPSSPVFTRFALKDRSVVVPFDKEQKTALSDPKDLETPNSPNALRSASRMSLDSCDLPAAYYSEPQSLVQSRSTTVVPKSSAPTAIRSHAAAKSAAELTAKAVASLERLPNIPVQGVEPIFELASPISPTIQPVDLKDFVIRRKEIEELDLVTDLITMKYENGIDMREAQMILHHLSMENEGEMLDELKMAAVSQRNAELNARDKKRRLQELIEPLKSIFTLKQMDKREVEEKKQQEQRRCVDRVEAQRESRVTGVASSVSEYVEQRRHRCRQQRAKDLEFIEHTREQTDQQHRRVVAAYREKVLAMKDRIRDKQERRSLMTEFCTQQATISNALKSHDRVMNAEATRMRKANHVSGLRANAKRNKELVNKYLVHRELSRRSEANLVQSAISQRLIQDASDRVLDAKQRVQKLKELRANVRATLLHAEPTYETELCVDPEKLQQQWDTTAQMYSGRIGNHPTAVS